MRSIYAVAVVFLLGCANARAQSTNDDPSYAFPRAKSPSITSTATLSNASILPKPQSQDWAQITRYVMANAALAPTNATERRVVFFGDSITDNWGKSGSTFFPGKPYINRGIGGQSTTQMLIRFEQDVVNLHPAVVVILAGINDIAQKTPLNITQNNIATMITLAKENGIRVVLASITPVASFAAFPDVRPVPAVRQINAWMRDICSWDHVVYLDYFSAMDDGTGAMKPGLSIEGLHPTTLGYAVMAPLAETAIRQALSN